MFAPRRTICSAATDIHWWAGKRAVAAVLCCYCALFALITGVFSSAFNIDDEIAAYAAQVFALNYSSRNPPLYYWILYGLQRILDPSPFSFALVRYGILFLFGWTVFAIARRAIVDPRLQALSVYSISLLWLIGYHSHRINTHSNLMIAFIAGTVLIVLKLVERPSVILYALLGGLIALGTLSKFGYLGFLAVAAPAALSVRPYRGVLIHRRIVFTFISAGLPLGAFFLVGELSNEAYFGTVSQIIVPQARGGILASVSALATAWIGYLFPFLPLFLLLVWPWGADPLDRRGLQTDDARRFLRNMLIAGTALVCMGVLITRNANLRDRHFHEFYALATVYAFAEVDRRGFDMRRLRYFSAALIGIVLGIASLVLVQRLAPSPRLWDLSVQSAPHLQFGRELRARFGKTPTLVAPIDAGQFRINMPAARVIELAGRAAPPPSRATTPCVLLWRDEDLQQPWLGLLQKAANGASVRLEDASRIALPRYAPLRFGEAWPMVFYTLQMPDNSKPCQ